jgi:hypothetical protein
VSTPASAAFDKRHTTERWVFRPQVRNAPSWRYRIARAEDAPRARIHSAEQCSSRTGWIFAEERKRGSKPAILSTYPNGQCRFGCSAQARTAFFTINRLANDTATDWALWRWWIRRLLALLGNARYGSSGSDLLTIYDNS